MDSESIEAADQHFRFAPIEQYFLVDVGGEAGFWLLFLAIAVFAIITYKLGFAKQLPIGKSLIVYGLLVLGCFLLILFAVFSLPIVEVLMIVSTVLGIYRFRLHRERNTN
ncbi:YlaH-like family protein [Alkalibacillus salilacus]|uniref:CHASE2 domain-containing sensor protein n=1 Tax=Alkalibacillus salilacus TaxID=284582 RepID=A0ABT9VGV9_9BACI|nr:YlaH-like family protein [Alkalibacillus salilacus]MDQ0160100.1 CHASE2 domain-containing sensor protein [Alkalibacillus salilacus]